MYSLAFHPVLIFISPAALISLILISFYFFNASLTFGAILVPKISMDFISDA
jgi:hypothetical protein